MLSYAPIRNFFFVKTTIYSKLRKLITSIDHLPCKSEGRLYQRLNNALKKINQDPKKVREKLLVVLMSRDSGSSLSLRVCLIS